MTLRTRVLTTVAAIGLVVGGCSGDNDAKSSDQQTTQSALQKEQQAWAKSLCTSIAPTTAPIQPPATAGVAPSEAKKSIATFLDTLGTRLDAQGTAFKQAGPPPGVDAAVYDTALKNLTAASDTLDDITQRFTQAKGESAEQIQSSLNDVSEGLAISASYGGPIAEMAQGNASLKAAFESTDACKDLLPPT